MELFELTYSTGWGNYAQYMNDTVDAYLEADQAARTVEESYPFYQAAQWDAATETGVAPEGAATWVWLANVDHLHLLRARGLEGGRAEAASPRARVVFGEQYRPVVLELKLC